MSVKLNLGAGDRLVPGYLSIDRKFGSEVYPLDYKEVDEIRASHVLEHFSHRETAKVLKNWVDSLKPGGVLKIAVPDFKKVCEAYLRGDQLPIEGYVMGGHVDKDDHHGALFDDESLREMMTDAGLTDIKEWASEIDDCASLSISLNLQGVKNAFVNGAKLATMINPKDVGAAMSVPRLGFMDNFTCVWQALVPLKMELRKHTGAFWGQCLERNMEEWISEGKKWILTIDYDSIFTKQNVIDLLSLAARYPEAHAIAPVQASRTRPYPLMTVRGDNGKNVTHLPVDFFDGDLGRVHTAHFGLTLINVEALKKLPKPWFWSQPGVKGWGEDRTDDDIYFWRQWEKAGNNLFLANHVSIGHAELMIRWPGEDFRAIYQHPSEFYQSKLPPDDVWK